MKPKTGHSPDPGTAGELGGLPRTELDGSAERGVLLNLDHATGPADYLGVSPFI